MNKIFLYISLLIVLLPSCQEININTELKEVSTLDSILNHEQLYLDSLNLNKVRVHAQKAQYRTILFEDSNLSKFQKKWLEEDRQKYHQIHTNLNNLSLEFETLKQSYKYTKSQIRALKEDLIHRHLKKEQFMEYLKQEKIIQADLGKNSNQLLDVYHKNIRQFDSLEFKLQGILTQLDAIDRRHENATQE